jgi:tetratricopeptide (TPR) repeat protein
MGRQSAMTTMQAEAVNSIFDEAVASHQAGRLAEARRAYEAMIAQHPTHFDALHLLGVACVQSGETEHGAALIERAIDVSPNVAAAHVNLAMALNALGRFEAAIRACDRALTLDPDSAGAHANRGNALIALGRFQGALASYDRVVALAPTYAEAHYNRANALRDLRRFGASLASYERAIALRPTYVEALNNRAGVLAALGRIEDALAAYEDVIAVGPDSVEAHANRAKMLNDLWRSEEALAASEQAIAIAPDHADAQNNRAIALHELGRTEAALETWMRVVAQRPDHFKAHNNIGMALQSLGRPAEAVAAYDRALALAPDFSEAHLNRASSLLALGDLARGFEEYRWRWVAPEGPRLKRRLPCPLWEGESLAGKAILVHCEQGYGDALQFVRFAPLLARMVARVTVLAEPPLVRLLGSIPGIEVTDRVTGEAAYDFQIPLLCTPRLLGTTLETIPAQTPYLFADPAKAAAWAARLLARGEALRVGLVWAGGTRNDAPSLHAIDRRRSVRLEQYAPLSEIAGVRFFSLQKDGPAAQARQPPAGLDLTDWAAELRDFADTAALVAGLDLVITVDTSVAHLAGALGKPVWVLSRFDGCWRWLNGREDSPWYPTARVFHQKAPGAWDEVIERVASELATLSKGQKQAMSRSEQGGGDQA